MTSDEYQEVVESLSWCQVNGFTAFEQWYRDLLNEADRRGKLPPEAFPPEDPNAEDDLEDETDERTARDR